MAVLNCPETLNYMLSFAREHKIISRKDEKMLKIESIFGKVGAKAKNFARKIIFR